MGGILSVDSDHPDVVLVPPLFERDHKGRSRMAKSSYDFQFAKPQLKWLFRDYNRADARSLVYFSPPEDPRVSITARIGASMEQPGKNSHGSIALRFQPEPTENLTFFDLKAAPQAGHAQLRGCYFDHATNLGAFAAVPLTEGPGRPQAAAGLRYSSPELSAGFITQPFQAALTHVWLVAQQGAFTYGWQARPHLDLRDLAAHPGQVHVDSQQLSRQAQSLHHLSSYSVAYSPARPSSGGGRFTAAVEVREQRQLIVSFLHHLALQRQCRNYFEDAHVVGITNYLDLGMQVVTPLAASQKAGAEEQTPQLIFGMAWQANKNLLVKVRAGTADVSLAAAFKAWWQPSLSFAASMAYDFASQQPRLGLNFNVENYGNIRYERSQETQRMGKALVQRHVAQQHDMVNKSGEGLLVRQKDLNDPHILGQERPASDQYL